MARCKLTRMNLRNIRKSKEYQCLLIDLVKTSVIGKSAAEGLLGYTIPAGLLGNTTPVDDDEDEGGETGGETNNTVTLLYYDDAAWQTAEYDLTNDPNGDGIIDFAKTTFGNSDINNSFVVTENPEYVEGESSPDNKYIAVDPRPEAYEPGMLITCFYFNISGGGLSGGGKDSGGQIFNPPVTTRTVAVKAYGTYQPSCGGPMLSHFHDEHYNDVNSLDIEISSNDSIDDVKDKILDAYNTKCGATGADGSGNQTAGSLAGNPADAVIFITDVSFSSFWTVMDPQPSDISAFDDTDTIEVILS